MIKSQFHTILFYSIDKNVFYCYNGNTLERIGGDQMYKFKTEKYNELLDGRSMTWLSEKLNYSRSSLYKVLNEGEKCKKIIAIAIIKTLNKDYILEDFFEKIDDKGE